MGEGIEVNCDGAYSNAIKDAGYGVVVRGNCGEVIGECGGTFKQVAVYWLRLWL